MSPDGTNFPPAPYYWRLVFILPFWRWLHGQITSIRFVHLPWKGQVIPYFVNVLSNAERQINLKCLMKWRCCVVLAATWRRLTVMLVLVHTAVKCRVLLTSARLPGFLRTNWGSPNGIIWVVCHHKWSPQSGAGSPGYPLTLFKAKPFTVRQTAVLTVPALLLFLHTIRSSDWFKRYQISNSHLYFFQRLLQREMINSGFVVNMRVSN